VTHPKLYFFDMDETLLRAEPWEGVHPAERKRAFWEKKKAMFVRAGRWTAEHERQRQAEIARMVAAPVIEVGAQRFIVIKRPNIELLLDYVRQDGELHVYTAADPEYAEAALSAVGLRDFFGEIFCSRPGGKIPRLADGQHWVLHDDIPDMSKVRLMGFPPHGRVVKVEPFVG
jgi:FMN phosphatase YigB (HAD superfamily)